MPKGHKPGCGCFICDKSKAGTKNHKKDCVCTWCGPGPGINTHPEGCECGFHGGLSTHKENCGCPVCNKLGSTAHRDGCQCSWCGPPTNDGGSHTHRDGCECPWCSGSWPGNKETGIEKKLQAAVKELGFSFETQVRVGPYRVDVMVGDVALEANGDYWHSFEDPVRRRKRDNFIRRQGYSLWHFKESEINDGSFKARLARALR